MAIQTFALLLVVVFSIGIYHVVYNIFFHPLKRYPGPLGARATSWWKTYVEVIKGDSMVHVIIKLHEEYGLFLKGFLLP